MSKFDERTTDEAVDLYQTANDIFDGLIKEVRELSKKKPDAILNKGKVKIINRVLQDLQIVLAQEPEKKFLDLLDDEDLPQTSDAVLVMVQYESVLADFPRRYQRPVKVGPDKYGRPRTEKLWITESFDLEDFPYETQSET
ncbi:hypothetical protein ACIQW5_11410 [Methylorubrum thiocyanatum]|uniref:hypothetical protein n=1 Tax=Methylorubrum thiocyanatum TaxID=47958 RepID=UPI00383AC16F